MLSKILTTKSRNCACLLTTDDFFSRSSQFNLCKRDLVMTHCVKSTIFSVTKGNFFFYQNLQEESTGQRGGGSKNAQEGQKG